MHYHFKGDASQDKRSPFIVASAVGASATDIDNTGFICIDKMGMVWLHGHKDMIINPDGTFKGFPPITQVPVFHIMSISKHLWHILEPLAISLLCPNALNVQISGLACHRLDPDLVDAVTAENIEPGSWEKVVFLSNATGIKGHDFITSTTGVIMTLMASDYTGNPTPSINLIDCHPEPRHESNSVVFTEMEIATTIAQIKQDSSLILCIHGATVACHFVWRYLFGKDAPHHNISFFEPFIATILGIKCIVVLCPHIGVLNYVGHLPWMLEAFADFTALAILFGSKEIEYFKHNLRTSKDVAASILQTCYESPLYKEILQRLMEPKLRCLWNGVIASTVQELCDEGIPWDEVTKNILSLCKREPLSSLKMPTNEFDGQPVLIPSYNTGKTGTKGVGNTQVLIAIPDPITGNIKATDNLSIPLQCCTVPFSVPVHLSEVGHQVILITRGYVKVYFSKD